MHLPTDTVRAEQPWVTLGGLQVELAEQPEDQPTDVDALDRMLAAKPPVAAGAR